MDRDALRNVVLALFGTLAVALTAATLPTAVQPDRRGEGGAGLPGPGDGGGGPIRPPSAGSPGATIDIPFLAELLAVVAAVAVVAALGYLFVHWRTAFRAAVVALALGAVGLLFFQLFSSETATVVPPSMASWVGNGSAGGGDPEATTDPTFAPVVAVLGLVLAVLGTVVAVRRRSDEDDRAPSDGDGADDVTAAMGRAAGRAAARIEESDDIDNEVYRAWREMTALLDVARPETNTPGEFETAAIDAGMDPADVRELTELFELVRYGEYELDRADERRAVALLDRLETRYSEGET